MNKNDPIKNLTEATPEGHPARAPERHPSKETPARMPLDGRIGKRVPREVHVRLVLNEPLLIAEKAVTVNVTSVLMAPACSPGASGALKNIRGWLP